MPRIQNKVYKRDVTIYVTKNGDTYSSSATKPTITFNGSSQTVNPNGNTFTGVLDGTYTINVGATTYNDSKSVSVDVSSGNTSFTVDVVGYYDLKVTYQWYINDVYNNGVNYCYGATVYLRNSSGSNLTNTTTNSSGLATISASSYKVGNNSYTLYRELHFNKLNIIIKDYNGIVPDKYKKTVIAINEEEVTAYKLKEASD